MKSPRNRQLEPDLFADLGHPIYRRVFDDDSDFVRQLSETLAKAHIADPVEIYLSRTLAMSVVAGVGSGVLGIALGYLLFGTGLLPVGPVLGIPVSNEALLETIETYRLPLLILLVGVVLGLVGFGASFGVRLLIPYMRSNSRKREINILLPDAVSYMYALSIGGLNQLEILEAMARADDTYGEVAREFRSIVKETDYFDTDYRTAIREQSFQTPSEELGQFLTDMLSIINSGGDMTAFLDDKKETHMKTAKQQDELTLETLELFGEMYMTLSLFPILLVIVTVIMSMLGEARTTTLYGVIYGLIPVVGVAFLILVSTVKQDEIGDGYLELDDETGAGLAPDGTTSTPTPSTAADGGFTDGIVESYSGRYRIFDRIKKREDTHETIQLLQAPHKFFRDHPLYTLAITVPAAAVLVGMPILRGQAPTSWSGVVERPVWGTFVYVYLPLFVTVIPLTVFYEWNVHSRKRVLSHLSNDLRKLASANDTGLTLLDAIKTVGESSSGTLAREFEELYAKVRYGTSLKRGLVEFNNKYHIPRLTRTVKLISKAQETSSQISEVLLTAAKASENQDDIERERTSRTRMQVAIILMSYFTLLAVMAILKTQFIDVMAGLVSEAGSGGTFGASVDPNLLSLLFFHAVTIQAVLSGFIAGYIRTAKILSGLKFVVVLLIVALGVWIFVG